MEGIFYPGSLGSFPKEHLRGKAGLKEGEKKGVIRQEEHLFLSLSPSGVSTYLGSYFGWNVGSTMPGVKSCTT